MTSANFVCRLPLTLRPDPTRVLIRPFWPATEARAHNTTDMPRALKIMTRILALEEADAERLWEQVREDFHGRHAELEAYLLRRFEDVKAWLVSDTVLTRTRKLLIGAYFTHEYSLEAAALFNPSMVRCPDQSNVAPGGVRFILSLRAVGEGHISSLCFRCGVLTASHEVEFSDPARWVVEAKRDVASFDNQWFGSKCAELGLPCELVDRVVSTLPAHFTEHQLVEAVQSVCGPSPDATCATVGERLLMLAKNNFQVSFHVEQRYSERVIFPVSPSQLNGIEDARFVHFIDDDKSETYYATYTAYDGRTIFPQLLETRDFLEFRFSTLSGGAVQNKGMALFPRRIDGKYVMISRQDSENIRIMFSDDVHHWEHSDVLARPTQPWEFIQMGNCGSPLEVPDGWIVLTHGVGAMRKYCIGALLLDKDDPSKIIGRMKEPLIRPAPEEREGYVPNVVYTCGGMIHNGHLVLPFATADWYTSFALVPLKEMMNAMEVSKKRGAPAKKAIPMKKRAVAPTRKGKAAM